MGCGSSRSTAALPGGAAAHRASGHAGTQDDGRAAGDAAPAAAAHKPPPPTPAGDGTAAAPAAMTEHPANEDDKEDEEDEEADEEEQQEDADETEEDGDDSRTRHDDRVGHHTDAPWQVFLAYRAIETGPKNLGGDGTVDRVAASLEASGYTVFASSSALDGGQDWANDIQRGISECSVFIAICSPSFGETKWTMLEVQLADNMGKPIVPLWHSGTYPPSRLEIYLSGVQRVPRGNKPLAEVDFGAAMAELRAVLLRLGCPTARGVGEGVGTVVALEQSSQHGEVEDGATAVEAEADDPIPTAPAAAILHRTKLMLVGAGGAGKTTLVTRLLRGMFDPNLGATDGLGVHEWALPLPPELIVPQRTPGTTVSSELTFSLWDFGGQDMYYTTHPFFMGPRSVYLLLWRSRSDQELDGLREYLSRIQALAPGAPMVLVGTHAGEAMEGQGAYTPPKPPPKLFADYPQLHKDVCFISSKTGYGVDELKRVLVEVAMAQPGTRAKVPGQVLQIRDELRRARDEQPASKEPLMPLAEYKRIAEGLKLENDSLSVVTELLVDYGDVLHFPTVPGLDEVLVLRPQWVGDVMARVVTLDGDKQATLNVRDGRVSKAGVRELMAGASPGHADALVRLMETFNLLHSINDTTALVPALLQSAASTGVELLRAEAARTADSAQWRWWHATYQYSYVPDALLCRALCRLFALPHVTVLAAWRFGAVVQRNKHLACVEQGDVRSGGRNKVAVTVCGPKPEVLGCLVSSKLQDLLAEAFPGVRLEDVHYGCAACFASGEEEPGIESTAASIRKAKKTGTARGPACRTCDEDVDVAGMAERDDQAMQLRERLAKGEEGAKAAVSAGLLWGVPVQAVGGADLMQVLQLVAQQQQEARAAMEALSAQVGDVRAAVDGGISLLAAAQAESSEDVKRRVLALHRAVAAVDAKPMPTLHVVLPVPGQERAWWDVKGLVKARFRLHLLCEHTGGSHMTDAEAYEFERPKEWLRKHATALRILAHTAGLLLGAGVKAATSGATDGGLGKLGGLVDQHVLDEPLKEFEHFNQLLDKVQREEAADSGGAPPPPTSTAVWTGNHSTDFRGCQEARRELQVLIEKADPHGRYGNLQKVFTLSGDVLWLCKEHATQHQANCKLL